VEWEESCCTPQVERIVPVYHETDVLDLQSFLRDKLGIWASNGSCVEEIWSNFKEIVSECIERFIPHKILRKTRTPNIITGKLKYLKKRSERHIMEEN
jgi:hypothetical protein